MTEDNQVQGNSHEEEIPEMTEYVDTKKQFYELICFVSGGFTDRLNRIHEILLGPVSKIVQQITLNDNKYHHQFKISFNRLNETPFIAQDIQKNVFENIRKAHFLVADISPQFKGKNNGDNEVREREAPNPSVMHEIGYAMALSIPVFLIGESNTRKQLPANLKGSLVTEYECCDSSEKPVEEKISKAFSQNLAEHIVEFISIAGTPLTPGQFLIEGYRIRLNANLPYLIRDARYRVYILTTNLQYIESRLKDSIEYALDRNAGKANAPGPNRSFKIDILTMDPESIVTNIRGRELNRKIDEFRDELRGSLTKFKDFSKAYNSANIEIGTYVSLPTIIMFVIDDTVIFSIPFSSQRSRLVPHFIIANDPRTIQQFIDYFFIVKSRTGGQTLL